MTVVYGFLDFDDGGAQRLALSTWRCLDRGRFRPVLLCVRGRGELVAAAESVDVPAVVLGRLKRPFDLAAVPAISRELRAQQADIVHVPLYSRASPYLRLAARVARVGLTVAHEHCRGRPPARRRRVVDRMLGRGTRFVAVSEAQRTDLVCQGVSPEHIAVIGNGVDVERFRPRDRAEARLELGLAETRSIVLVPARLVARKAHVDLIAALSEILSSVPELQVLCAGDGPLREALPALAESAGVGAAISFLGHREDMPALAAACDVVCLPSHVEGMPLALLEAMASGRAVVATGVDGVPEIVMHGVTGLLVPPGAPDQLAAALVDILTDDQARHAMEDAARRAAMERHRDADMTRRLETAYETWLAKDRLPPAPAEVR